MTDRLQEEITQINRDLSRIGEIRRAVTVREDRLLRRRQLLQNQVRDEATNGRMPVADQPPNRGRRP